MAQQDRLDRGRWPVRCRDGHEDERGQVVSRWTGRAGGKFISIRLCSAVLPCGVARALGASTESRRSSSLIVRVQDGYASALVNAVGIAVGMGSIAVMARWLDRRLSNGSAPAVR